VNVPSTWRLASRNKNLQNQSKRASNPYAKKTRKMFVSRHPGVAEWKAAKAALKEAA
jgi:DNA polymerase I-like protein with 3'-5' exonuclease and polymerase domains